MGKFYFYFLFTLVLGIYGTRIEADICDIPQTVRGFSSVYHSELSTGIRVDGEEEEPKPVITAQALEFRGRYHSLCLRLIAVRMQVDNGKYHLENARASLVETQKLYYHGYVNVHAVKYDEYKIAKQELVVKRYESTIIQLERSAQNALLRYESAMNEGNAVLSKDELLDLLGNTLESWRVQREITGSEIDIAKNEYDMHVEHDAFLERMVRKGYVPGLQLTLARTSTLIAKNKVTTLELQMKLMENCEQEFQHYIEELK